VHDLETFFHSIDTIEKVDPKHISELYNLQDGIPLSNVTKKKVTDESAKYFIVRNEKTSALARYNRRTSNLEKVEKLRCYGIEPRNAEQTFSLNALMDPEIQLVALTGKAGTGKTLLALAAALQQEKDFETIYLARPIVPLANRDLGFLPGDVNEKIGPYMQPLYDNLSFIKHKLKVQSKEATKIDEMQKNEKLQITPLAYIRGRSLSNAFFIVDEAQNLTPHEVKTIITRAGEGTKMVFTGDIQQIDSPYLDSFSNGLSYLTNKMQGQEIFAHIHLLKGERSYLADLAGTLL
jgi:PhoH-like ATPase